MKQATAETFVTIIDDCDNVLGFLQAVAVKSPQVTASPLSLFECTSVRASGSINWTDTNLTTPPKPAPKDHMGLTGVLTDVATKLKTAENLRPSSPHNARRKMRPRDGTVSHRRPGASY